MMAKTYGRLQSLIYKNTPLLQGLKTSIIRPVYLACIATTFNGRVTILTVCCLIPLAEDQAALPV